MLFRRHRGGAAPGWYQGRDGDGPRLVGTRSNIAVVQCARSLPHQQNLANQFRCPLSCTSPCMCREDARARLAEVERRQRAARRAKRRAAKAANLAELALQDGPPPAHADGVTQPQSPHQLTASEIDALIPIEMGMCLPAPLQPATGDVDAAAAVHVPIDTPRDEMGGLLTSPREKSSNDAIIISNDGRDHEFVDGGGSELPSTAVRAESPAGQGEAAEVTQGVVDAHMHRDEVIMAPDASGSELATAAADHHQEVASDTKPAAANDREGIMIGEASSDHLDHIDGGEADKHDGSAAAEDGGSYTTAAEDDHDQLQ